MLFRWIALILVVRHLQCLHQLVAYDNNQKENWTEDVSGEYIFFEDTDGNGGYSDGSHTYYFASSINGNKLILRDSGWLAGKSITITKLTKTELHITATDENSEENYEMIKR